MNILRVKLLFCLLGSLALNAEAKSPTSKTVKVVAQSGIDLEGKAVLAVHFENAPQWHTYWKNPGDAGLPLSVQFKSLSKPIEAQSLEWPVPRRHLEDGGVRTFGYEGSYSLFFRLPRPKNQKLIRRPLSIEIQWLACQALCVPGGATLTGQWDGQHFVPETPAEIPILNPAEWTRRLQSLPQEGPLPAGFHVKLFSNPDDEQTTLYLAVPQREGDPLPLKEETLWIPFPHEKIVFGREELFQDPRSAHLYARHTLTGFKDLNQESLKFIYSSPQGAPRVITVAIPQERESLARATALESHLKPLEEPKGPSRADLLSALCLAFFGGLILNLMPCVLPVISLKLFGLVAQQGLPRRQLLRHTLGYAGGVLSTFLIFAVLVLGIKASGEEIGWGFQLQSPTFVAFMILVLLLLAANLFGFYEFSTPGGRSLGRLKLRDGWVSDFGSGVLATVLATPCSAPFLGTALTFAFGSPPLHLIAIFSAVGLGLSAPFLMTALVPASVRFLPRPGPWMESLKRWLGLSLLLTLLWLWDVLGVLVDLRRQGLRLHIGLVLIFFALSARRELLRQRRGVQAALMILGLLLYGGAVREFQTPQGSSRSKRPDIVWEAWNPGILDQLRASNQTAFIDFTAQWCLTCQVNKKLVLETSTFQELAHQKGLRLIRADWTQRDPDMTRFLKNQGTVAVPAYFVLRSDGALRSLGERVTTGRVQEALDPNK